MNPSDWLKSFGEFVTGLNLPALLPLSNGLSAVALILATLLILFSTIRGRRTPAGNIVLVVFFCVVALALVGIDKFVPTPKASVLHISASTIPTIDEAFPIHVKVNSESEWNLFTIGADSKTETLGPGDSFLIVNAAVVADMLERRQSTIKQQGKQISTLLKYAPKDRQKEFLPDLGGR